jgi:hypothetical protein
MKGKIAQTSLAGFSHEERKVFLGRLLALPNGELLARIGESLLEPGTYSDRKLLRSFHLTQNEKDRALKDIGKTLLSVVDDESIIAVNALTIAKRLVFQSEYDAAVVIIETGIRHASQEENYLLVLKFWNLVEYFHEKPTINGMSKKEAIRRLKDISQLNYWTDQLRNTKPLPPGANRFEALRIIRNKAMAREARYSFAPTAHYMYLKLLSMSNLLLFEFGSAVEAQKTLINHVIEFPITCLDPEFILLKETRILMQLLWINNQTDEFNEYLALFDSLPAKNKHAQYEKIYLRFPFLIAVAIHSRDRKAGYEACHEFLELLNNKSYSFSSEFITQCLYYCAYFYFFASDKKELTRIFTILNNYSKSKFSIRFYLLYQLIRITNAIESEEWEDAFTFSKNLKSVKGIHILPGLTSTIDFIMSIVRNGGKKFLKKLSESTREIQQIEDQLQGVDLLHFFDLFHWLRSYEAGRPMIDIEGKQLGNRQYAQDDSFNI